MDHGSISLLYIIVPVKVLTQGYITIAYIYMECTFMIYIYKYTYIFNIYYKIIIKQIFYSFRFTLTRRVTKNGLHSTCLLFNFLMHFPSEFHTTKK